MDETNFPEFETKTVHVDGVEAENFRAIVRKGHEQPANILSKRYVLVQHQDVYKRFEEAVGYIPDSGREGSSFSTDFVRDGQIMITTLNLPKFNFAAKRGDVVNFGIKVVNSVDGSTGVLAIPFSNRVLCGNGMTHMEYMRSMNTKHMGGVNKLLGFFGNVITNTLENFTEISNVYAGWVQTNIDWDKTYRGLVEGDVVVIPDKYLKEIDAEQPKTRWDMFNALTSLNTHDSRRNDMARIRFDRQILRAVNTSVVGDR